MFRVTHTGLFRSSDVGSGTCISWLLRGVVGACLLLGACPAYGQRPGPWLPRRGDWHWHNPRTALSSAIHSQADLMRAQGRRAVDFAAARLLVADAVDKELDNWLKHLRTYWQRNIEYEQNRIKLNQVRQVAKDQRLNDRRWQKSRAWERIKNNSELNKAAIENGKALNFLLDRLANTVGTYDIARLEGAESPEAFSDLQLTENQLHALRLSQTGVRGGKLFFRADGSSNVDLQWWPYKLRGDELKAEREAYMKARRDVFQQVKEGGELEVEQLERLKKAFGELSKAFYEHYVAREEAEAGWETFRQFYAARSFIQALDAEIARLESAGDGRVLQVQEGFPPEKEGSDIMGLLAYMNRNGLRFAQAQPGDEPAYHSVFRMMRDIYVTVADFDQALQPQNLTEQLE
ncbi:MAG: hypothetical protein ACQESR_14170 [Planctomycetota bacterium]